MNQLEDPLDILLRSLSNIKQEVNVVRRKVVEVKMEAAFNSDWEEFFPNNHTVPIAANDCKEDDIEERRNQTLQKERVDDEERSQSQNGGRSNQTKLTSFSQSFLHRDNKGETGNGGSRYLTILQPPLPFAPAPLWDDGGNTGYKNTILPQSLNDLHPERPNSGLYHNNEPYNRYNSQSSLNQDFYQLEQFNQHSRQPTDPRTLYRSLQPHSSTTPRECIKDFRPKSPVVRKALQPYNYKPREVEEGRNLGEPKRRRLNREANMDSQVDAYPAFPKLVPTTPLPSSSFTSPTTSSSPSPAASTFQTLYAQIPMSLLPKEPLPPSCLPQHLLPPSLRSTSPPVSPVHSSFLANSPLAATYTSSSNYSSSPRPYFSSPRSSTASPVSVYSPIPSPTTSPVPSPTSQVVGATVCSHCGTSQTSLWRRDSNGWPLCNACKLYLKVRVIKH